MRIISSTDELRVSNSATFQGVDGVPPYYYSLKPDQAGGTIDSITGVYTAPDSLSIDPRKSFDTVLVTDARKIQVEKNINVLSVRQIIAKLLAEKLSLAPEQVLLQNQKFTVPNDDKLYISIVILDNVIISNNTKYEGTVENHKEVQTMLIKEMISVNIMSSNPKALHKRFDLIAALNSTLAQQKQQAHAFRISKTPVNFTSLSNIEGATIPFEYNLTFSVTYGLKKVTEVGYYDNFPVEYTIDDMSTQPESVEIETINNVEIIDPVPEPDPVPSNVVQFFDRLVSWGAFAGDSVSIGVLPSNAKVKKVEISVQESFDGGADITVGKDSDQAFYLSTEEDLTAEAIYKIDLDERDTQPVEIKAYLSGNPTQGRAHIYIEFYP